MMRCSILVFGFILVSPCCPRSTFEPEGESVVSVYTTLPTTAGTAKPLDVYHQIANNIAERITSPIYRFLGINRNHTEDTTTKRAWVELQDDINELGKDMTAGTVDNTITNTLTRDVEELSVEALNKVDKKPEKITLFSSYLPFNEKLEANDTIVIGDDDNTDDFSDDFDDFGVEINSDDEKRGEGGIIFFLEWIGSIIQLAWGAFIALFAPKS